MPPTGGKTGRRNHLLGLRFGLWAERDGSGVAFDSSTGFLLPNGAERSPDLAWVRVERWQKLSESEQEKFVPLCPDFAVELRSPSDSLSALKEKCAEYIANGASLVWLIDPMEHRVHVYSGATVTVLEQPAAISGDPALDGLVVELGDIL